ncbi:NAD(P)H-hydrate dehydratase [Spongiivirga citrea]|uniref:Bifunctional NAD(P)H-hydrate repair enzyme n=1 Tax=Spongiivirga citrea TaxID=1481457 RepID=A0A6M0CJI7_9FLAO|nr:NAD(P)H-hydrate dehydratase [Spongiivirga citrea]NER16099.1 NAD(P)H-hydrate dehydratase [Spongiivirga citrea]
MKIFSAAQIYEADKITTERQGISSIELMERAATQVFNWMHQRMQGAQVKIHVFCGIGNNGGDGLVLARHLYQHGYNVDTYVVNCSDKRSKNFLVNYDRIKAETKSWPTLIKKGDELPEIGKDDIIVDAIFGIGINRCPDDWVITIMQGLNNAGAYIVSVDIPSGLFSDKLPEKPEAVIRAGYTLSFQTPKLIFFLPQTGHYTEQWEILDIGLDRQYLVETQTAAELIGKHEVLPIYQPREKFDHKGTYGHSLIIGGSHGKIGAVQLASRAALTAGAGLVTAYVPGCGYHSMQTALPEAMVLTDSSEEEITQIKFKIDPTVIGLGMGMGTGKKAKIALEVFLKDNRKPLVIDADALNIMAADKTLLELLPENTVLTPHPGELERLVGKWEDDFDKLERTKAFAAKYKLIVTIKGANTITVHPEKIYINVTGNPGMATAGSGDVLTGIITGLISQGYDPLQATVFGVYLHGTAGDLALEGRGYQAMIAGDIINHIGKAYVALFKQPEQEQQQEE